MLARIKSLWPFVLRRSFDRVVDSAAATLVVEIEQRRALADALIDESVARRHAEAVASNNAEAWLGLRGELAAADELVGLLAGQLETMAFKVDELEYTLADEEAGHSETLDMLGRARGELAAAVEHVGRVCAERSKLRDERDATAEARLEAENDARDAWRKLARLKAQVRAINTN